MELEALDRRLEQGVSRTAGEADMTWPFYLIALWPLAGLIVVFFLCRAINKSKARESGKNGSFEA